MFQYELKFLFASLLINSECTHSWEQRRLGDACQISRGLTYSPSDITSSNNGVRVLRSSNINEDQFCINEDDVFVKKEALNIPEIKNGDILITSANGSSRLVGKHAIISNIKSPFVHGGFMLSAHTENPYFLNASMSSPWYDKFINLYVSGGNGAIGNLRKNDLEEYKVSFPINKLECKAIGEFFNSLDTLITLHQHKLDFRATNY